MQWREQGAEVGVSMTGSTERNRTSRAGIKKYPLLPQELLSSMEMQRKKNAIAHTLNNSGSEIPVESLIMG